jgi:hypothetical protein
MNKKIVLFIRRDDFVNWYFPDVDIVDYIKQSLIKNGFFSLTIEELFEEVGFLPYSIVNNPLSIDELDLGNHEIDLEKYKVKLL